MVSLPDNGLAFWSINCPICDLKLVLASMKRWVEGGSTIQNIHSFGNQKWEIKLKYFGDNPLKGTAALYFRYYKFCFEGCASKSVLIDINKLSNETFCKETISNT